MPELSVRHIAEHCLGVTGSISIDSDVYGYIYRDTDGSVFGAVTSTDTLPESGAATTRSLKSHLTAISGKAFDIVPILVGHDSGFTGVVTRDQVTKIQYAIQVMRDLYATVDLGVRRVRWRRIDRARAGSYIDIDSADHARNLTDDFSGPSGGIDVFFVQTFDGADGWSGIEATCDKDAKDEWTGAVLEVFGSRRFTGILLAHEVGHYLGLNHAGSTANLMGKDIDGVGQINSNSTAITAKQGKDLRNHCSVKGC